MLQPSGACFWILETCRTPYSPEMIAKILIMIFYQG
jgi:hypothetical protein